MFYTTGIIISTFLALILLTKKKKALPDFILAAWLFIIAAHLLLYKNLITGQYREIPALLGFEKPVGLLHGVFIYLYTLSLTSPNRITWRSFLHFIPFTLALLFIIPFLLLGNEEKLKVYQHNGQGYELLLFIILVATIVSGLVYSFLAFRALMAHRNRIKENFSYSEKINLQWLFNLIIGISLIWILVIIGNDPLIFSSVIAYVLYIGFFGIKQVGIFNDQPVTAVIQEHVVEKTAAINDPVSSERYEKSRFSQQQLEAIYARLKDMMDAEKLFLTPELTLAMVAEKLHIHPNTLSEVINRVEQKNFFDYINTLRIEEFKTRIQQPENQPFTLLSIAYDCGFNSKTSFNRNFRNITGQSPSAYLRERNISLQA